MVALAVAGILVAVAAPALQRFVTARAVVSQAEELASALRQARSEALKRGLAVAVCASSTVTEASPSCAGSTDWATGWLVFTDADLDGDLGADDRLLKVQAPLAAVEAIEGSAESAGFHQNGISVSGEEPSFSIRPRMDASAEGYNEAVRRVVVNKQGRVQILVGAE